MLRIGVYLIVLLIYAIDFREAFRPAPSRRTTALRAEFWQNLADRWIEASEVVEETGRQTTKKLENLILRKEEQSKQERSETSNEKIQEVVRGPKPPLQRPVPTRFSAFALRNTTKLAELANAKAQRANMIEESVSISTEEERPTSKPRYPSVRTVDESDHLPRPPSIIPPDLMDQVVSELAEDLADDYYATFSETEDDEEIEDEFDYDEEDDFSFDEDDGELAALEMEEDVISDTVSLEIVETEDSQSYETSSLLIEEDISMTLERDDVGDSEDEQHENRRNTTTSVSFELETQPDHMSSSKNATLSSNYTEAAGRDSSLKQASSEGKDNLNQEAFQRSPFTQENSERSGPESGDSPFAAAKRALQAMFPSKESDRARTSSKLPLQSKGKDIDLKQFGSNQSSVLDIKSYVDDTSEGLSVEQEKQVNASLYEPGNEDGMTKEEESIESRFDRSRTTEDIDLASVYTSSNQEGDRIEEDPFVVASRAFAQQNSSVGLDNESDSEASGGKVNKATVPQPVTSDLASIYMSMNSISDNEESPRSDVDSVKEMQDLREGFQKANSATDNTSETSRISMTDDKSNAETSESVPQNSDVTNDLASEFMKMNSGIDDAEQPNYSFDSKKTEASISTLSQSDTVPPASPANDLASEFMRMNSGFDDAEQPNYSFDSQKTETSKSTLSQPKTVPSIQQSNSDSNVYLKEGKENASINRNDMDTLAKQFMQMNSGFDDPETPNRPSDTTSSIMKKESTDGRPNVAAVGDTQMKNNEKSAVSTDSQSEYDLALQYMQMNRDADQAVAPNTQETSVGDQDEQINEADAGDSATKTGSDELIPYSIEMSERGYIMDAEIIGDEAEDFVIPSRESMLAERSRFDDDDSLEANPNQANDSSDSFSAPLTYDIVTFEGVDSAANLWEGSAENPYTKGPPEFNTERFAPPGHAPERSAKTKTPAWLAARQGLSTDTDDDEDSPLEDDSYVPSRKELLSKKAARSPPPTSENVAPSSKGSSDSSSRPLSDSGPFRPSAGKARRLLDPPKELRVYNMYDKAFEVFNESSLYRKYAETTAELEGIIARLSLLASAPSNKIDPEELEYIQKRLEVSCDLLGIPKEFQAPKQNGQKKNTDWEADPNDPDHRPPLLLDNSIQKAKSLRVVKSPGSQDSTRNPKRTRGAQIDSQRQVASKEDTSKGREVLKPRQSSFPKTFVKDPFESRIRDDQMVSDSTGRGGPPEFQTGRRFAPPGLLGPETDDSPSSFRTNRSQSRVKETDRSTSPNEVFPGLSEGPFVNGGNRNDSRTRKKSAPSIPPMPRQSDPYFDPSRDDQVVETQKAGIRIYGVSPSRSVNNLGLDRPRFTNFEMTDREAQVIKPARQDTIAGPTFSNSPITPRSAVISNYNRRRAERVIEDTASPQYEEYNYNVGEEILNEDETYYDNSAYASDGIEVSDYTQDSFEVADTYSEYNDVVEYDESQMAQASPVKETEKKGGFKWFANLFKKEDDTAQNDSSAENSETVENTYQDGGESYYEDGEGYYDQNYEQFDNDDNYDDGQWRP